MAISGARGAITDSARPTSSSALGTASSGASAAGQDQAGQPLLVGQRVAQRDEAAHAVAEHEHRHARLGRRRPVDERVDVGDDVVHVLDEGARTVGAAVAAMVERVDGVALADEPGDDVVIAAAVLAQAVDEDDDRARRRVVGRPGAPEDVAVTDAAEGSRGLGGHACSSAHGTTTASSWGESRATTYSAGSESETFSTTWVTRGGT